MITFEGYSDDLVCVTWTTEGGAEHSDEYCEEDEFLIGTDEAFQGEYANGIIVSMYYEGGVWGIKSRQVDENMPGFNSILTFEGYSAKLVVQTMGVPKVRRSNNSNGEWISCDRTISTRDRD